MKMSKLKEYCATEPFMLLYWLATGIHLSVLPQLVIHKLCIKTYNTTVCGALDSGAYKNEESVISKEAASWDTVIFLTQTVPSIFQVFCFGLTSDILNKKLLLLLPPAAMALQSIVYLVSSKFMNLSIGLLVFGASVTCSYGDLQGAIMLAYSYLADITNKDQHRTLRMVILESCLFMGQATGSYVAGRILQRFGFVAVFSTSLGISVLNFLYVAFILPSISSDNEYKNAGDIGCCARLFSNARFCLGQMCVRAKSFISNLCFSEKRKILIPILSAVFFTNAAILGENVIIVLFLKHSPLNLMPREIGQYLFLLHIARGIGVVIVAIIAVKVFKPPDLILALVGLISLFLSHIFMGTSKTRVMLYAISPVSICAPLAMSAFRSITTKEVPQKEHGVALSSVAVVSYLGLVVMTFCANDLYKATASFYSGAAILLLASSTSVAFLITLILFITTRFTKNDREIETAMEMTKAEDRPLLADEEETTDKEALKLAEAS